MEEAHGKLFSESESPRALIFQRGYKNATSVNSIIKLMRSNNLTAVNRTSDNNCKDAGNCNMQKAKLWSALGYRGDIVQDNKKAYGIIDTKVVCGKCSFLV